jgi:hypothetical protein
LQSGSDAQPDRNRSRTEAELDPSGTELHATIERLTDQVRLLTLLVGQNHDELVRLRREERRPPDYCAGCPFVDLVRSAGIAIATRTNEHTPSEHL